MELLMNVADMVVTTLDMMTTLLNVDDVEDISTRLDAALALLGL